MSFTSDDDWTELPPLGPPWPLGAVEVSRDQWVAAAVIAGLRMASNADRLEHRSRGREKNALNDIQGVIGELIALNALERVHGTDNVSHSILHWDGGMGKVQDDVDLVLTIPGHGTLRFESKCHLDEPRKKMLLVNRQAHERSTRRGSQGYIPIVGLLGHEQAHLGHLIHTEELDRWPTRNYRYDDPALGRPLKEVSVELFGVSWRELSASLRSAPKVACGKTLRRVARGAERRFGELRDSAFDLAGLPCEALVKAARAEARACYEAGADA